MAPDGHITIVSHPPTEQDNINAYKFGQRWRVDGSRHKLLFQDDIKPIYNPLQFGDDRRYNPVHDPYRLQFNASLVFTLDEVRVRLNPGHQSVLFQWKVISFGKKPMVRYRESNDIRVQIHHW
ncbi:unnamed protein product [Nippostrongylus brasiliensis]|uniref:Protein mesh (inferred by orthology to a D. melanogaster protein) n=1 Tax=Nippostrongylus brasiliensis TaxID=27835 RepID=A0A0N4XMW9_NIPBR|nr:unnamed protein product [Nippostrongylus brasiliensis]